MLAINFILLVISIMMGYTLGWLLTEKYRISAIHPLLDFEAFRCRQCLSFHIAWVVSTIISLLFKDFVMMVIGIAMALVMYWGLRIDEKNKTIKIKIKI